MHCEMILFKFYDTETMDIESWKNKFVTHFYRSPSFVCFPTKEVAGMYMCLQMSPDKLLNLHFEVRARSVGENIINTDKIAIYRHRRMDKHPD